MLEIGTMLSGRYEVLKRVGSGEEGAVGEFLIFIRIGGWFRNHEMDGKLFADSDKMVK